MKKSLVTYSIFLLSLFSVTAVGLANDFTSENKKALSVTVFQADIYPNPAVDYIFLKFQDQIANDVTIEVRSFIGNPMETTLVVQQSNLVKISIDDLPAGHYYAIISYNDEKTLKKFIKRG